MSLVIFVFSAQSQILDGCYETSDGSTMMPVFCITGAANPHGGTQVVVVHADTAEVIWCAQIVNATAYGGDLRLNFAESTGMKSIQLGPLGMDKKGEVIISETAKTLVLDYMKIEGGMASAKYMKSFESPLCLAHKN